MRFSIPRLKEALAIQLEQSPLLQLVSDSELHSNLQYLGQSRDQKITPELAQQLGQRLGVKAYLAGTIANLGTSYVISINAVNCATGEVFAREQDTAPDKTAVLQAVSKAATAMRARLGESMASIQKLTTPYTNVTTGILQAFHAFSLGEDEHRMGRDFPQASSFYQEAIRLDPGFAMAYARLGVAYGNVGALGKSLENLKKAYDLRERVTERERMYIESQYALQQLRHAQERSNPTSCMWRHIRGTPRRGTIWPPSIRSSETTTRRQPISRRPGKLPSGTTSPPTMPPAR